MKTLQQQYNLIKEGKGDKVQFVRQARSLFPQYFNQYTDFDTATNVLKSKQIISEATAGGVVGKGFDIWDWKKILAEESSKDFKVEIYGRMPGAPEDELVDTKYFSTKEEAEKWIKDNHKKDLGYELKDKEGKYLNESVKAVEKEISKEAADANKNAFQPSNMKNVDNINFNEIMKGFYCEMKVPENADKTGDELKAIVVKNLAKDPLYYTKNGEFGTKGLGYTDEAPGLGKNTQPKSKNASVLGGRDEVNSDSEIVKNSLVGSTKKNVQDSLSNSEAKTSMPKKVKEMPDKGVSGVEKKVRLKEGADPNTFELGQENPDDAPMGVNDKAPSKPMKAKVDIKSTLEKIATPVFTEKDLNKAKEIFKSHIESSGINEKDKNTILKNIEIIKTKTKLDSYLVNSLLHYEGMGTSQLKENINPKYTHFAIRKSDGKIVNGWEYKNLDNESIREYCKMDLKDQFPDSKVSEFTIITKKGLENKGVNPFDTKNWYKIDETKTHADPHGVAGDEEKEKEAKATQVKKPNPNVKTESILRSLIHDIIKEELQEEMNWDKFNIQVSSDNYEGTIKRDEEGWMMYDEDNQPEEAGPFKTLDSLMSYYDLIKSDLVGDYVKNLK